MRMLNLRDDFGPVPTSEWEAAIARDLKGADYDKKLVWRTEEGIAVRPYYRSEHAPRRQPLLRPDGGSWRVLAPGDEPVLDASGIDLHEQGATAVEEAACALARGADALAAGRPVRTIGLAVGSNFAMEVAKLRAVRILWEQVRDGFAAEGALHIHVRASTANKTLYDPCVNLLRVTTEAISAIVGGCDSLTVPAFRFDAHLAENVHHILREESHLARVADPGAGSYYFEHLTDEVARAAWTLFQRIESAGGFASWSAAGSLDTLLASSRAAKEKAFASRRRVLVGTNHYPNVEERALDAAATVPAGWRLASVMEAIRLRTERHAKATGRTPRVLLLEHGDLKMRKARSAFCLNFFGCAGFDLVVSDTLQEADLVVLCSSDPEYPALAGNVCPKVRVPVVVAGNPKDQIDALRAAGVADFVHVQSNAVETLTLWQSRLGIEG